MTDYANPDDGSKAGADLSPLEGVALADISFSWTPDDVSLYASSIGAEEDGTGAELDLTWGGGGPTAVFPTFGVLASHDHSLRFAALPVPTTGFVTLYAEHSIEIFGPVPVEGSVTTTGSLPSVTAVDTGALVVRESVSRLDDGGTLWVNRATTHVRGAGAKRRATSAEARPVVAPDHVIPFRTTPNQALLYGLNGDKNPLHGDPRRASKAGFDAPILHGLCTFGIVTRRLLLELGGCEWASVTRVGARFRKPVVPGEAGSILVWRRDDGWSFEAWTSKGCVLRNGSLSRA